MKKNIPVWKPQGWTPLEAVNKFKLLNKAYSNEKVSYAGRLDPMAEGVLLLLVGDENKNRKAYENLEKVYVSEVLFGVTTDTFDALGVVQGTNLKDIPKEDIDTILKKLIGKRRQIYPPYSSKAVMGKPLYWWSREKRLNEITLPAREIEIYESSLLGFKKVSATKVIEDIEGRIRKTKGNFRQEKILKSWRLFFAVNKTKSLTKAKIRISCSGGTYIRRIASDIGEELGVGAIALSIKRVRVGNSSKKDCVSGGV